MECGLEVWEWVNVVCRYLNDLNYLEIREGTSLQWQCPVFDGPSPSPRESHAAVTISNNRLLIYGGMNGRRLDDVWILEVGRCLWCVCKNLNIPCFRSPRPHAVELRDDAKPHPTAPESPLCHRHQKPAFLVWWVDPCTRGGRVYSSSRD